MEHNFSNWSKFISQKFVLDDRSTLAPVKDHLDWTNIKRTSQLIKQKAKNESCTVDEEFENLKIILFDKEKQIKNFAKYMTIYVNTIVTIQEDSSKVGQTFLTLFNSRKLFAQSAERKSQFPLCSESNSDKQVEMKEDLEEELRMCAKYSRFTNCTDAIVSPTKDISKSLLKFTLSFTDQLIKLIENIRKKIRKRSNALFDYDRIYNMHENLLMKQSTSELTLKQSQQIHNLERKLKEYEGHYKTINNLLKSEIYMFLEYMGLITEPLIKRTYFMQLTIINQIYLHLSSESIFDDQFAASSSKLTYDEIIKSFKQKNKSVTDIADSFSIFKPISFASSLYVADHSSKLKTDFEYCKVLHTFSGQENGDLNLQQGQIVKVIDRSSSWWKGELNGTIGTFPGNYVELVKPVKREQKR